MGVTVLCTWALKAKVSLGGNQEEMPADQVQVKTSLLLQSRDGNQSAVGFPSGKKATPAPPSETVYQNHKAGRAPSELIVKIETEWE